MLDNFPPFNIDLLLVYGSEALRKANMTPKQQIKVMDIMTGMTKNFHPEGLYSTEIFGKVGDNRRNVLFGYIDLHIAIFHPVYFKAICDLKELYGGVMAGREYATFDQVTRDFVKSDPINGETGFRYFLEHFRDLKFAERDSAKRKFNIALVEKYRKSPLMDKLLVLPAGLRDYTIDDNGKPSEDEINNLYRRVIGTANVIEHVSVSANEEYLNNMRYNLQVAVNLIYDYITDILEGKGKLVQGKWIARNIDNSTRNVITPNIQKVKNLNDVQFVSATQTVVGLYQFLRSIFPKAVQLCRDGYLSQVFVGQNSPANLVDPKTLHSVSVQVDPSFFDDWMTVDGLGSLFHRLKVKDLRHEPVMIGKYYLGLIYVKKSKKSNSKDDNVGSFKFFQDISDLPAGFDKSDVHPVTYAELFYLSVCDEAPVTPCTITRYPVTGFGSIYPSYVYLKSTVTGLPMRELVDEGGHWVPGDRLVPEFPLLGDTFFDALSPASQHLGRLGGDYDGDTCSFIAFWTDDSKAEFKATLNSRDFYVAPDGNIAFSSANDVIDLVLGNLA